MYRGIVLYGAAVAVVLMGCGSSMDIPWDGDTTTPTPTTTHIAVISGDAQIGAAGTSLAEPLVVEVRDPSGAALPGVALDWTSDVGTITPVVDTEATLELDVVANLHTITVSLAADPTTSLEFTATGTPTFVAMNPPVAVAGTLLTVTANGLSSTVASNALSFNGAEVTADSSDVSTMTVTAPMLTEPTDATVRVNGIASPELFSFAPYLDRAGAAIAGTNGCNVFEAATSRNVAMGPELTLYVAAECGNGGAVIASLDGGVTFEPAITVSANANDISIQATDVAGELFAAWVDGGDVFVSTTTDFGKTFSTPAQVGTNREFVSLAYDAGTFYVGSWQSFGADEWTVAASADGGQTWPVNTTFTMATAFGDLVVDPSTGNVYAVSDDPDFHIRASTNGGQSFGAE